MLPQLSRGIRTLAIRIAARKPIAWGTVRKLGVRRARCWPRLGDPTCQARKNAYHLPQAKPPKARLCVRAVPYAPPAAMPCSQYPPPPVDGSSLSSSGSLTSPTPTPLPLLSFLSLPWHPSPFIHTYARVYWTELRGDSGLSLIHLVEL